MKQGVSGPRSDREQSPTHGHAGAAEELALWCPKCGYDLRASASPACPECGVPVDREALRRSTIPWVLAERWWRWPWGYAATVWRLSVRPNRLADEGFRPVDPVAAWRFRGVSVALGWAAVCLPVVAWVLWWEDAHGYRGVLGLPISPWVLALPAIGGVMAAMWWATALPRLWMRGPDQPTLRGNRGVALADYTAGVLGWWPVVTLMAAAAWGLIATAERLDNAGLPSSNDWLIGTLLIAGGVTATVAGALLLTSVLAWAFTTARFTRRVAGRGPMAAWLAVITLPVGVLVIALLTIVLWPLLALMAWVIWATSGPLACPHV